MVQIAAVGIEIKDQITDELPRSVKGGLAPSIRFDNRKRKIVGVAKAGAVAGSPDRVDRLMLKEQDGIVDEPFLPLLDEILLQTQPLGVIHSSEPTKIHARYAPVLSAFRQRFHPAEKGTLYIEVAEIRSVSGGAEELCCEYRFEYVAFGRRVAANDPDTGATRTVYDPASGRVIDEVDPEGRTTGCAYYGPAYAYAYTPAGQLAERRWARDSAPAPAASDPTKAHAPESTRVATRYAYDPATLQLTAALANDGTEVRYEHDPEGRLLRVTDSTGTRSFRYDGQGRVVRESVALALRPGTDPIRYEIHRPYTAPASTKASTLSALRATPPGSNTASTISGTPTVNFPP